MINIDSVIPREKVLQEAHRFLESCSWTIKIADEIVTLPSDLELVIQTRAFISAEAPDIFLGDHYEAVVMLGREITDRNWIPLHGYLKLYFNLEGQFVTEDRFSKVGA